MSAKTPTRCYMERAPKSPPPLFQNGNLVFQAHHVGWLVSGIFALVATIASAWLIYKHLRWYTNKREQRYIVRILFLVPIYGNISFASYLFWNRSTPLLLIRDCYEAIVLTAFFYLLLMFLSPEPEEQQRIIAKHGLSREADKEARLRGQPVGKWVFPLNIVKWKPQDGLYFLQLMKYGVLQYTVIRPATTLAAVVLDYVGLYCESSWSPRWGHIYITAIVSVSVSIAMYCLVQLYVTVSTLLASRRPLLKLFAIKAVVFLTFWQSTFLSLLVVAGVVKNTTYMTAEDINIGIGAILETFEMTLFALLHIKAFSYLPYKPSPTKGTPPQPTPWLRSLGHAMDFRETCREIWSGCVYLLDKTRGKEPSNDRQARRAEHYENAFSRPRPPQRPIHERERGSSSRSPPPRMMDMLTSRSPVFIEVEREVDIEGERQWLGTGDNYIYGLEFMRRERSEGLEVQFEREMAKRGYAAALALSPDRRPAEPETSDRLGHPAHTKRDSNPSWWRSIYNRLSQSDPDADDQPSPTPSRQKDKARKLSRSRRRPNSSEQSKPLLDNFPTATLEDLPPQSLLETYQQQRREERRTYTSRGTENDGDILTPLPVFEDARHAGMANSSRHSRRQSAPIVPLDRQSNVSSQPATRPVSGVEINPNYLAPVSNRSSRYSRADSVLGRLFPDSMTEGDSMSMTDFGTTNDGTHSIFSMSTDRVGQARKTPRARLTNTTPQIMTRGAVPNSSARGTVNQPFPVPEQLQPSQELPHPSTAQLLSPALTNSLGGDKRRASSHGRPLPIPPTQGEPAPYGPPVPRVIRGDLGSAAPKALRHHASRDDMDIPTPRRDSQDLRRNNAQVRPRAMSGPPERYNGSAYPYMAPASPQRRRPESTPINHPPSSYAVNIPVLAATKPNYDMPMASDVRNLHHQLMDDRVATGQLPPPVMGRYIPSGSSYGSRSPPSPQSQATPPIFPRQVPPGSSHGSLPSPQPRLTPPRLSHYPPSPQPPHPPNPPYQPNSANPYSTINRLRKHQDSRHARTSPSPPEMLASPSRTSQITNSSSRSYTNGASHAPRSWQIVDYPSTSWYLPSRPKS